MNIRERMKQVAGVVLTLCIAAIAAAALGGCASQPQTPEQRAAIQRALNQTAASLNDTADGINAAGKSYGQYQRCDVVGNKAFCPR